MARKTRSLCVIVGARPALRNLLHFLPVAHHTQRVGFRQSLNHAVLDDTQREKTNHPPPSPPPPLEQKRVP